MTKEIVGYRVIQNLFPVCSRGSGEVIPLDEIADDLRPDAWVVAGFCEPVFAGKKDGK
jgi:hypothetical protein